MTAPILLTNDQILSLAPAAGALEPIDGVSKRYSFVPTIAVVELLREVGWFPIDAEQSLVRDVTRDGYQKHLIRFAKNGLDTRDERVDLLLYNSHDRGTAFRLIASIWRKVCGNGLMVSAEFANFTHKHVGFDPDAFMQSAIEIANSAGVIVDRVEEMKMIELSAEERGSFAEAAHILRYGKNPEKEPPINALQLLNERRYDDKGKDLWTSYNVVQENIVRGGLKGSSIGSDGQRRHVKTRAVKAIDKNIQLNQALWHLTECMAKLKVNDSTRAA